MSPAVPILIDTDMGVDDAAAVVLAFQSPILKIEAIVATGGNVSLDQAQINVGRLLRGIAPPRWPPIGRGLDQQRDGIDRAHHVHGDDGLGGANLPPAETLSVEPFLDVYRRAIAATGGKLHVVAIGPLTTLAAALREADIALGIAHIHIMGGAVWSPGNVTPHAEFNFHRDPQAAADVLAAVRPITVTPLDVTRTVIVDESHVARLAASASKPARVLAEILAGGIRMPRGDGGPGRMLLHDPVSIGAILWPDQFVRVRMKLEIATQGDRAGQSKPRLGGDPSRLPEVLTRVSAADFLENFLEALCGERFVV